MQAEEPGVESVLSDSQDVARCHHLKSVGRDLLGTDTRRSAQHREAISKMVYEVSHGIFGKRVTHLLHIYCLGQNWLGGCLLAMCGVLAFTLSLQKVPLSESQKRLTHMRQLNLLTM